MKKIREIKLPKATDLALSLKNDTEDAQKTKEFCDIFKVETNSDLDMAVRVLAEIKVQYADYEERRKSHVESILNVLDDINSFFRPALDALSIAESVIKDRIEKCVFDRLSARDTVLERVEIAPPPQRALLVQEAEKLLPPKISGLSFKEPWQVEIEKGNKTFDWIVKNKKFEFLTVNKKAITAFVKAKDEDPTIPGVVATRKKTVIITASRVK